jgi:hypothetical protein
VYAYKNVYSNLMMTQQIVVYGCKNVYPNLMMHSSKLNHSYSEQRVQYVQGRLGPQQTSLHNKHPIRKCELLEAQTLGPQVNWYFNLFEAGLSLSIFSLKNVKFRLGDPDSVLGEETHTGAGRFL